MTTIEIEELFRRPVYVIIPEEFCMSDPQNKTTWVDWAIVGIVVLFVAAIIAWSKIH